MNKYNNIIYNTINIFVIILMIYIFKNNYWSIVHGFKANYSSLFQLVFVAFSVHVIKATRLYIALYGTGIEWNKYIKIYCKVTPVSIIFPFKLGEIFRIYNYGYLINNYFKGTIIILLDRFMDTIALLSIVIAIAIFNCSKLSFLVCLLALFLIFLLFAYKIFPNMYKFWKDYYLKEKATKKTLWALNKIEIANKLYNEVMAIVKGRGIILYLLSVCAWILELFNLILITKEDVINKITEYLLSALNLSKSAELNNFVFISIILLITTYLIIKIKETMKKKEVCKE